MVFLTGATGFLGSYILLDLLENGFEVRALKRSDSSMEQVERTFKAYAHISTDLLSKVEWVNGDILDVFSLQEKMQGIDIVVHCAGLVSFDSNKKDELAEINVEGTANIVNVSLQLGIKKFLYVSSIAAMGRGGDDQVITEKTVWKNSKLNSQYSISKYNGEKEVWRGREEGLNVVVINPSIILGYGDKGQSTYRFLDTIKKGLRFYPIGMNGFVYVKDVSRATTLLLQQDKINEKFIISAENLSYFDFFSMIARMFDKKVPSIKIGKILTSISWRAEIIRSALIGSKPLLTKETALTTTQWYEYDGSKIKGIEGFQYTPIENCLKEIWTKFKKVE